VDRCRAEEPQLKPIQAGRLVACHRADEVLAGAEMPHHLPRIAGRAPRQEPQEMT
jgi:hypothetical protein